MAGPRRSARLLRKEKDHVDNEVLQKFFDEIEDGNISHVDEDSDDDQIEKQQTLVTSESECDDIVASPPRSKKKFSKTNAKQKNAKKSL